jgi:hypothetical protein
MVKDGTPKNGTQINIQIPSGYLTLPWKITIFKFGKPSINGPFSIAMLNNQRVTHNMIWGNLITIAKEFYMDFSNPLSLWIWRWDIGG